MASSEMVESYTHRLHWGEGRSTVVLSFQVQHAGKSLNFGFVKAKMAFELSVCEKFCRVHSWLNHTQDTLVLRQMSFSNVAKVMVADMNILHFVSFNGSEIEYNLT